LSYGRLYHLGSCNLKDYRHFGWTVKRGKRIKLTKVRQ